MRDVQTDRSRDSDSFAIAPPCLGLILDEWLPLVLVLFFGQGDRLEGMSRLMSSSPM